ncbi:hypothetical protein, partial [Phenylobacterium sp.]|uniref:hypothetical protein n=1 Tax=Phenylobacterium sp. TaxID=1871053 RepID=UPI002811A0DF
MSESQADRVFRVVEKARAVAGKITDLRRVVQDSQVREAVTRTELTVALHESLAAREALAARLRVAAAAAYRTSRGVPAPVRRHGGLSRRFDRLLARLGAFGQAVVIARSGVWRGSGRPLHNLRHMAAYARRGPAPAVTPLAPFDQGRYLASHPDVAGGRTAPLVHYLLAGSLEGRAPHPLFDEGHYRRQNAGELAGSGVSALEHYVRRGAALGCSPHPAFDVGHYLAQGPTLAAGDDPVGHYMREGWMQGLSPHPLFDPAWYVRQAGRAARGIPPLVHYLTEG